MEMMDALVKAAPEKGLVLTQVPKPVPGMGEVLIKIHKTAICGTDVHIYNWNQWAQETIKPPMVIGHEYVGEIAELGPGVTAYHVGQIVSGEGHIVCGHCRNCRAGNGQYCRHTKGVGVNRDGAFAEYLCIPASNVVPIPDGIPEDVVSFFDALGNATHTALMFDVIGEDVLITGAGPIGMMATAICRRNGARSVVVTDVNDYRLEMARKMGATATVNVAHDKLESIFGPQHMVEGFDVGLEMSGNVAALNTMIDNMRNGGKEPRHQRFPVVDHAGLEGEGVPQELIPGHCVLQQRLGGHADGIQPPARQRAQHRQAAVLVLAARALHWPQHEVPGWEHRRGQAQRLEVVRKVGGLGLAGGHDADQPSQILLQSGVQQGTARRRQAEQRRRARGAQALRDLLIFRCAFQQRFVHRRPPLEANTFGKLNPTVIASQCHRPY